MRFQIQTLIEARSGILAEGDQRLVRGDHSLLGLQRPRVPSVAVSVDLHLIL